jgi:hypothetical protein
MEFDIFLLSLHQLLCEIFPTSDYSLSASFYHFCAQRIKNLQFNCRMRCTHQKNAFSNCHSYCKHLRIVVQIRLAAISRCGVHFKDGSVVALKKWTTWNGYPKNYWCPEKCKIIQYLRKFARSHERKSESLQAAKHGSNFVSNKNREN